LLIALFTAVLIYLYGAHGPFYRTEPALLPISFSIPAPQQANFRVDRTEEYLVEVHLSNVFEKERMETILGDFQQGGGGRIDISWRVLENTSIIAAGSSRKYGYSPIFSSDEWGLVIGAFRGEKGKDYVLDVTVNELNPGWDLAEPYIAVGLHPSKLEGYLVLQFLGVGLFLVFGILLGTITLAGFYRGRKSASGHSRLSR
jgi:hypothetical protein